MIRSAAEFISLRFSDDLEEQRRAGVESASLEVWTELIERYPDARVWVAHNKTVPLEILRVLARLAADSHESVRLQVARHRRTPRSVLERLRVDDWSAVRDLARSRIEGDA